VNFCDTDASDVSSVTENCGAIPQIDYQELLEATHGWDKHNILGKGGFGTVFKGNWKNTQVAVKRIEQVMEKILPTHISLQVVMTVGQGSSNCYIYM
jgi:hypothetical protein